MGDEKSECSIHTGGSYEALDIVGFQEKTEQRFNIVHYGYKILTYIFPATAAIIAIVIIISAAIFSLEIAQLKTETDSLQQSSSSEQILLHLITSVEDIRSSLNNQADQLNISIDLLHQHALNSALEIYQQQSQNLASLQYKFEQLLDLHPKLLVDTIESPASSCAALSPNTPSGYYWVSAPNGSAVRVYCDMTMLCGEVTGGWMRASYLDMTNSSHQCPGGSTEHNNGSKRTCRGTDPSAGCWSVLMDIPFPYSMVCGRVRGYQVGSPNAFRTRPRNASIDSAYVDGVSFTINNPRQHLWTFAAGLSEVHFHDSGCPCYNYQFVRIFQTVRIQLQPYFVGANYFCEAGTPIYDPDIDFYPDDPLWDGYGCLPDNVCCLYNNPPWFHRRFSQAITENIEMRVCRDEVDEDIAIEIVEIYIQ